MAGSGSKSFDGKRHAAPQPHPFFAFSAHSFSVSANEQQKGYTLLELPGEASGQDIGPASAKHERDLVVKREGKRFVLWNTI